MNKLNSILNWWLHNDQSLREVERVISYYVVSYSSLSCLEFYCVLITVESLRVMSKAINRVVISVVK